MEKASIDIRITHAVVNRWKSGDDIAEFHGLLPMGKTLMVFYPWIKHCSWKLCDDISKFFGLEVKHGTGAKHGRVLRSRATHADADGSCSIYCHGYEDKSFSRELTPAKLLAALDAW